MTSPKTRRQRARQIVAARLERLEDLSLSRLVPSTLTILGLCSGATAIRFALEGQWKYAVASIVCAMLFDMLDGRAARLLGADTRFGAQLDSLADLVSFGIAPALIVYDWSLKPMGNAGWIVALVFCTCSAIRLARFNVQSARDEGATKSHPYFTGLPTPAGACLLLLPMLISFQWVHGAGVWTTRIHSPILIGALIVISSFLMVSRLPTPSIKYMRLQRQRRFAAATVAVILIALLIAWPWATLTCGLLIYLASIPIGILAAASKREST